MLKYPPPPEVIDAFHLMWDNFPEPASLVHKTTEVIAVNKAHFLQPGVRCARTGRNGPHIGCRAQESLKKQQPISCIGFSPVEKKEVVGYWLPLDDYPNYFIHTGIRLLVNYEDQKVELSPMTDECRESYGYVWDDEEKSEKECTACDKCGLDN